MNFFTLFLASAVTAISAPIHNIEPVLNAPSNGGGCLFQNLTSYEIDTVVTYDGTEYHDIAPNESVRTYSAIDTVYFAIAPQYNQSIGACGNNGSYSSSLNWVAPQVVTGFTQSVEDTLFALYDKPLYDGTYYINSYQFPYSPSDNVGSYPMSHQFTCPSAPFSNKSFSSIKLFKATNDNTIQSIAMAYQKGSGYVIVGDNFGFKPTTTIYSSDDVQSLVESSAAGKTSNTQFTFYNGFDNEIVFDRLYIDSNPWNGTNEINQIRYITSVAVSYFGYSTESEAEVGATFDGFIGIIRKVLVGVLPIFSLTIFPGISLGLLLFIPLMFAIVLGVIKLVKS